MSVGREPVDRVVDVVVAVPLCVAVFTRDAIPVMARAGGRQAKSLLDRVAHLRTEPVPYSEARTPTTTGAVGHHVSEQAASNGTGAAAPATAPVADETLPIEAYDTLAARQVCDRLATLTSAERDLIEIHERANRGRRTVLGKIEQLRS